MSLGLTRLLCGGGSESLVSWAAQEAPSPREGEVLKQTQLAQARPPDPRPLASAFQPQLPSKCLLCPPSHPRPQGPRPGVVAASLLVKVLPLPSSQACWPGMAGLVILDVAS